MKKRKFKIFNLFCVLLVIFIFVSCKNEKGVKVNGKIGTKHVKVFEYDGCQYISVYSTSGYFAISHKGNCKYCNKK